MASVGDPEVTTVRHKQHENRRRVFQNVLLVWIDATIDENDEDCQHTLEQLRSQVNDVTLFANMDDCVNFLAGVEAEKAIVITSGSLGQIIVPQIHPMTQVDVIYIFCRNRSFHKEWVKKWPKIDGVYTEIEAICESLHKIVKRSNENNVSMSFVSSAMTKGSTANLDQLDSSFMYTKLFKDVLLEMDHEEQARQEFVSYCQTKAFVDNPSELDLIKEFQRNYAPNKAIWWYTRECFLYQMLNRALRLMEADIIVIMGFFIRDLHFQIEQIHQQQIHRHTEKSLTLYRGQRISLVDFEKMKNSKGGLMSFNSFLSTSRKRNHSLSFAKYASHDDATVGILFVMTIDPTLATTPFADIHGDSYFQEEGEVLFSMHSVFRVGQTQPINEDPELVEVSLTATADNDQDLHVLTDHIKEAVEGDTPWDTLGALLIKVGETNKAEEIYRKLLGQNPNELCRAHYMHQLGAIRELQRNELESIEYHQKALTIKEAILPENHPSLGTSYNTLGHAYNNVRDHDQALFYHEKALAIRQNSSPVDHLALANSYNNIGVVYGRMGNHSASLSSHRKALDLRESLLPALHPELATSYNNIGLGYSRQGEYKAALPFYQRALQIRQKALPANHPHLIQSYKNIGILHRKMEQYPEALKYHQEALAICEKSLSADHPDLAAAYYTLATTYEQMGNDSKALRYYKKALKIWKTCYPPSHDSILDVNERIEELEERA